MTQYRQVAYHDLDTSQLHNLRFVNVVKSGVYRGYYVRVNLADPTLLDITFGPDDSSVLVTVEGVRIQETEDLLGVLKIQPADSSFARYDLVVAEYQFTPDNSVEQVYKIIKGKYQTSLSIPPERPQPENPFQIPLAWVYVRPKTAVGGVAAVEVRQSDVIHVPRSSGYISPVEVSTLKPIVDPTNKKRLYVFPGLFPSLDGTQIIDFQGGYSDEIDDSGMADGETRYFLFGIADDGSIGVVGESSTADVSPEIGSNVLSLCIAKAVKRGAITTIDEIVDIRFPFSRRVAPQPEDDFYQDLLDTSIFRYVRIDDMGVSNLIRLDSLIPDEDGLTARMEHGDTSLAIEWADTGTPSDDVRISTKDLLGGTPLTSIRHIMILLESDAPDVTYDYSTVSSYSGFTGQDLTPGTIQEIPGGAPHIYIRFKIPKGNFSGGGTIKIYNYAIYMDLNPEVLSEKVISGIGLDKVGYSVPNLICNGDFKNWNRADANGNFPDVDSRDVIEYPIDQAEAGNKEKLFAADGWQFTKIEFNPEGGVIKRILWSRDALGSLEENTMDTALEWKGSAGEQGAVNHLEFRVLSSPDYEDQFVTFAFDYISQPKEAVGIRLVLYERESDGSLSVQDAVESGPVRPQGQLLLTSGVQINNKTFAIGFAIVFQRTTGTSTVYVRRARAAVGDYQVLPFTKAVNADDVCRKYYERGIIYASANVADGEEVGSSAQYGAKKFVGLGEETRVRQVQQAEYNRSVNVFSLNFNGTMDGFVVRGTSSGGLSVVDLDWESEVIYAMSD